MLRQRLYGLCAGYEDLNDHGSLRHDVLLQSLVEKHSALASAPTLCRFENSAGRHSMMELQKLLVELFIEKHKTPPKELVLDFDATDDPTHGNQQNCFYHGYYKHHCFLPLYVFCGSDPLFALLRPSNTDGARGAWAVLRYLVKRFREAWGCSVKIVFRGDTGFMRPRMLTWCEKHDVFYIVGYAKNNKLLGYSKETRALARKQFEETGEKQRLFGECQYQAGTWDAPRRIIFKAEYTQKGANPRHIVTNLKGSPQELYDKVYCARGDMENRIKEQQLGLFADRTSCHRWWANQLRLLLSTFAYLLLDRLRTIALKGTGWMKKQCSTLRAELVKIGAVVTRNTRRVKVHLTSAYPHQDIFAMATKVLRHS